jgi:hypothetical protein
MDNRISKTFCRYEFEYRCSTEEEDEGAKKSSTKEKIGCMADEFFCFFMLSFLIGYSEYWEE